LVTNGLKGAKPPARDTGHGSCSHAALVNVIAGHGSCSHAALVPPLKMHAVTDNGVVGGLVVMECSARLGAEYTHAIMA
jgi:hypothetical protein